jgi:hypothetical protein
MLMLRMSNFRIYSMLICCACPVSYSIIMIS